MLLKTIYTSAALIAYGCVHQALACAHGPRDVAASATDGTTFPQSILGSDDPSDPATTGYFINHLCINVRNATESINFYSKTFGLRHIFTLRVTEHFSISYMGHSHGGKNGTGYQTTNELNREKNNAEGYLELVSLSVPGWNLPASSRIPNTFGHIGMVVPDVQKTQKRLEEIGANIIKSFGEAPTIVGAVSNATSLGDLSELDQKEIDTILAALTPSNTPLIWVADPDGNLIEIQGQEGFGLVE
jgi:lactoylglutathione lyase